MINAQDRVMLEAAYAHGGRVKAVDTLLDTLFGRGGEWSDERLRDAVRFIRDLPRDEEPVATG